MTPRLSSYEEFWPFYVSQHTNPVNQRLHFLGTSLVLGCLALAVGDSVIWLGAAPVVGYGFAWAGHFFFEKNRPATFSYPLWSLRGDFRMYRFLLLGRFEAEVGRARQIHRTAS